MRPAATILIAARNAAATIERAVQSAVRQTEYPIVLVDDFSLDDTVQRAQSLAGRGLTVVRPKEHRTLGLARQTGLDAIDTPFGVWLDADDELLDGRVARTVAALQRENADLCADAIDLFDGRSASFLRQLTVPSFLRSHNPAARLFERNYLQGPGCIAFRTATARAVGYDPELHGAEDVDFMLRSIARGARFAFIDEPGYRLYAYPFSMSRRRENQREMTRRALFKHSYESVRGLFAKAGYDSRVCSWGLASMALFRQEYEKALEFIRAAECRIGDAAEVLEPAGPCALPEGWRVAFFRGSAMLKLERWDEAEYWLQKAEGIRPTAEGANNLGIARSWMGKKSQAEDAFRLSLTRFPEFADPKANLADATPSRITVHPLRLEPSRADY